jgi:DNA-3-methyladenine glycosylase I
MAEKIRCGWAKGELDVLYHDTEWGVPVHDDRVLFEFLTLEGAQAGLSWSTILKKREGYRMAFADWDVAKIAKFTEKEEQVLRGNAEIVRNKLKISSTVTNARAFLKVQKEFGSFDKYLWHFGHGKPVVNQWNSLKDLPASSPVSDALSKDLKRRDFRFIGTTICYAFMQAVGMVNDHTKECFRYRELTGPKR